MRGAAFHKGIPVVDSDEVFEVSARMIAEVANFPVPIVDGMSQWFDYCEKVAPKHMATWAELRKLDFAADVERLSTWLSELLVSEPPTLAINGFWFGLYNPALDDGEASSQMYVGGSTEFDPTSDSDEWVCNLTYLPEGGFSQSLVLPEIFRQVELIEEENAFYLGEPFLCHGYLALLVSNWCHGPMKLKLLGKSQQRAVVIGHNSGDFYRIAVLEAE